MCIYDRLSLSFNLLGLNSCKYVPLTTATCKISNTPFDRYQNTRTKKTSQNCVVHFRWFLFDNFKLYYAMDEREDGPVIPSSLKRRLSRFIPISDILRSNDNVKQTQEPQPPKVSEIFHILFSNSKINKCLFS